MIVFLLVKYNFQSIMAMIIICRFRLLLTRDECVFLHWFLVCYSRDGYTELII